LGEIMSQPPSFLDQLLPKFRRSYLKVGLPVLRLPEVSYPLKKSYFL